MQDNAPLLDLDLNSVDTSFPVLKAGMYEMTIKDIEVVKNSAQDGDMIAIQLATTGPSEGTKGEKFDPGKIIKTQISLKTQSQKLSEQQMKEIIVRNAAQLLQACRPKVDGIKGSDLFDGSIATKVRALAGRTVRIKLDALGERRDPKTQKMLNPGNEVAQWVKA